MEDKPEETAGIIAPPPLIYGGTFLIGYLLHLAYPTRVLPTQLTRIVGWPLIALAGFLVLWGVWALRHAGTPVDPYKSTTALVLNGPFRFSRNPMYLSLTLLYTGLGVLLNLLWTILLLPAALAMMHYGVIVREERYLERKFGEEYRGYRARVRRWI